VFFSSLLGRGAARPPLEKAALCSSYPPKELGLDEKEYKPAAVGGRSSSTKNALIYPEDYAADSYIQQEDTRAKNQKLVRFMLPTASVASKTARWISTTFC
jgi:hypothetical protein